MAIDIFLDIDTPINALDFIILETEVMFFDTACSRYQTH